MTDVEGFENPLPAPGASAIVVGAGMAGLVAARELALAGVSVTVFEAGREVGGAVAAHEVGGLVLDAGAESFATRSPAFTDLADALGLGDQLIKPNPTGAWVYYNDSRSHPRSSPLPKGATMGIPGDLNEPALREILGRRGLLRAKLDENLPKGVGAKSKSLADLVRARMGSRVLDRLVAPIVGGVYSVSPDDLDPEAVLPGIGAALAKTGSLSAAIASMRKPVAKAGSAVGGLNGGIFQIAQAVKTELAELKATLSLNTEVTSVRPTGKSWRVTTRSAEGKSEIAEHESTFLVVATQAGPAVDLLGLLVPGAEDFGNLNAKVLTLATVVVDLPELDAGPRGTGVLVAPNAANVKAKALTHSTMKWSWLGEEEGPGTHVLRLSYAEGALDGVAEADLLPLVLTDASALLGQQISDADVIDWDTKTWESAVTPSSRGQKETVQAFRAEVDKVPSLAATGAWLAGNGLVAVISDARKQARRFL